MAFDLLRPTYTRTIQALRREMRGTRVLSNFWRNPRRWPNPDNSKVFCCKALDIVGRSEFGSEWTSKEFGAYNRVDNWPQFVDTLAEFNWALSNHKASNFSEKTGNALSEWGEKYRAEYDDAAVRWKEFCLENNEYIKRLRAVCDWVESKARSGEICTFLRLVDTAHKSGEYLKAPDGFWNVEDTVHNRLSEGTVLFSQDNKDPEEYYIFFDKISLEESLLTLDTSTELLDQLDVPHLSPYLKLALAVIRKEGITPENQLKKDAVLDTVHELAPKFGIDPEGKTKTLLGYLATMIREPESQAGRNPNFMGPTLKSD